MDAGHVDRRIQGSEEVQIEAAPATRVARGTAVDIVINEE